MTPANRPPSAGRSRTPDRPSPAEPSPRSAELSGLIRAEIEGAADRRITFARFMELALYEPRLGYYRQPADRPTDAGDFLTAPETHAIFGWTVARRIESMWTELGRPSPFALVEYGAGSGTLALSVLEGFRRHGATDLLDAVRYEPVESNPNRLADLVRRFEEAGHGARLEDDARQAAAPPPATAARRLTAFGANALSRSAPDTGAAAHPGIVLANEFLDALPVHRAVVRGGRLMELFVALRDGRFVEVVAEPSTADLARRLADDGVLDGLAEGQVVEICLGLEEWVGEAAGRIGRGFILAIDYGFDAAELYGPRRLAGTLLGYRDHRVVEDPFADPGEVDLTTHVDFTAVGRVAAARGFAAQTITTQQDFLVAAGLEEEWRAFQATPELPVAEYTRARSGIVRMLDPRRMGRFRVLTAGRM